MTHINDIVFVLFLAIWVIVTEIRVRRLMDRISFLTARLAEVDGDCCVVQRTVYGATLEELAEKKGEKH